MALLNPSGIRFDETEHRYFKADGKELQGITGTIIRYFFPDTYTNVPQSVLDAAAEHGHYVHKCIEMSSVVGATEGCPESQEFLDMMAEHRMKVVEHEYIVTAFDMFASPIDVVLQDEGGGIWLADIKTTSALHEPKVKMQLSIYALFFEIQNPHLEVKGVVEIWLPKQQYRKGDYNGWQVLQRVSSDYTENIIAAYINMYNPETFLIPFVGCDNPLPYDQRRLLDELAELESTTKAMKARCEQIKEELLHVIESERLKKLETGSISVCYVASSKRAALDSSKVKKCFPNVYAECLKMSETKPSLRIIIKKNHYESNESIEA